LERRNPVLASYLSGYRRVGLEGAPAQTVLIDLRQK
jgi:hypothetical protein